MGLEKEMRKMKKKKKKEKKQQLNSKKHGRVIGPLSVIVYERAALFRSFSFIFSTFDSPLALLKC